MTPEPHPGRAGGIVLAAATLLAVVFVVHHPVVAMQGGAATSALLQGILRIRQMDHLVHGALIALFAAFVVGLGELSKLPGLSRLWARAGLLLYAAGTLFASGAALIDGFIIPDFAAHFVAAPADDQRTAYAVIVACGLAIQALTKLGLVLMSGGVMAWSVALLAGTGVRRVAGLAGVFCGGGPAVVLLASGMVIGPHVLLPLMAGQFVWNAMAAALLLHGSEVA